jgi:hypothetical protein
LQGIFGFFEVRKPCQTCPTPTLSFVLSLSSLRAAPRPSLTLLLLRHPLLQVTTFSAFSQLLNVTVPDYDGPEYYAYFHNDEIEPGNGTAVAVARR